MKKGFTLSEALIVMAAIGIVAVLTVPLLANEYQKKVQYTAFMKMYSTLKDAMQYAILEHGSPSKWNYGSDSVEDKKDFMDTYVAPYLKKVRYDSSFSSSNKKVRSLSGENVGTFAQIMAHYPMPEVLVLEDGSIISMTHIESSETRVNLFFDINGERGPNIVGRDMFVLRYGYNSQTGKPEVGMFGSNVDESLLETFCDTSGNSSEYYVQGETCSMRLLKEEKMNY